MRRFNDCEIYVLKLGQVVKLMFISTSRLWDEWGISMKKNITNYMYLGYTHMGSWMSNFGARVPILEVVKTHWSYNECLSKWAWMPVLRPSLVSGVAHVTKDACSLQWETPYSTKKSSSSLPPSSLQWLSTSFKKLLWALCSFEVKCKQTRLAPMYCWSIDNLRGEWEPLMKTWSGSMVNFLFKGGPMGVSLERKCS